MLGAGGAEADAGGGGGSEAVPKEPPVPAQPASHSRSGTTASAPRTRKPLMKGKSPICCHSSACSGEVDTGSPNKNMRHSTNLEPYPTQLDRIWLQRISRTATLFLENGAQGAAEERNRCAGKRRDDGDHEEEVSLVHGAPEAAEIAGQEPTHEAGGEPAAHHHGQEPRRRHFR